MLRTSISSFGNIFLEVVFPHFSAKKIDSLQETTKMLFSTKFYVFGERRNVVQMR